MISVTTLFCPQRLAIHRRNERQLVDLSDGFIHPKPRFVGVQFARRGQTFALLNELGDGAFGVEDALALDFGGMGREHGRQPRVSQHFGDVAAAQVRPVQALKSHLKRTLLLVPLLLMVHAPPNVMAVFGNVGQMRKVTERANDGDGLIAGEVFEQAVQCAPRPRVLLVPVGHRQGPNFLDQLESLGTFLFAKGVTQDAAK